jgi:hypothetical protein
MIAKFKKSTSTNDRIICILECMTAVTIGCLPDMKESSPVRDLSSVEIRVLGHTNNSVTGYTKYNDSLEDLRFIE